MRRANLKFQLPVLLAALVPLFAALPLAAQQAWQFSDVSRVVAIADIHGAFDAFERILERAGVIDDGGAWIGGETNLVIVGDVLDRGADSRRALDLIIALESEAAAAGGRVHFVLGNHEVMNLTGDLRYVAPGEFAAFAADETAAERAAGLARFRAGQGDALDEAEARRLFDERYPPGFFAHRRAFARDGVYGAWLLEQPFLIVIDGVAFVHAGIASIVADTGSALNDTLHRELDDYIGALESLIEADVLSRLDDVYTQFERAAVQTERADARRLVELQSELLMAPDGPIWYRGNSSCNRLTEFDRLRATLATLGADKVVVGHTPTRDAQVLRRMDDSIFRVDTGMLNEYYGGRASALVIENGGFSAFYEDETEASAPVEQPRHVGLRPGDLSEEALADLLADGRIANGSVEAGRASLLTLSDGNLAVDAVFLPAAGPGLLPPVAAYRLDRLLGLDMVPVTVAREIDDIAGSLQFWPARALSEDERAEQGLGTSAWCPLEDQIADMYRFDALIFNRSRTIDSIRFSSEDLQVMLFGHMQSFTTDAGRPDYLERIPVDLTPAWRDALSALDEAGLGAALGDAIDRARLRALLERRDALLAAAER